MNENYSLAQERVALQEKEINGLRKSVEDLVNSIGTGRSKGEDDLKRLILSEARLNGLLALSGKYKYSKETFKSLGLDEINKLSILVTRGDETDKRQAYQDYCNMKIKELNYRLSDPAYAALRGRQTTTRISNWLNLARSFNPNYVPLESTVEISPEKVS